MIGVCDVNLKVKRNTLYCELFTRAQQENPVNNTDNEDCCEWIVINDGFYALNAFTNTLFSGGDLRGRINLSV